MIPEKTVDYLKCAIANKVTLASLPLFVASSVVAIASFNNYQNLDHLALGAAAVFVAGSAGSLSFLTGCGLHTTYTYQKTKKHIKKYNALDERFTSMISSWYCDQAGLKLAAKEAGLEHLLPKTETRYL
ncbi:MAG TPA: hypothetical protein VJG49_00790 [Candidatus Nanoarchaeia archaeon]|nr:hypothetical protein [Candidatus Nanoarchaeia archaeon]